MQFQHQPYLDSHMMITTALDKKKLLMATQDPVLIIPKGLTTLYQKKMKGNNKNSSEGMDLNQPKGKQGMKTHLSVIQDKIQ